MKIQSLFCLLVLLLSFEIKGQVVDRAWKKDQDRFKLRIVIGVELDYFTTRINREILEDDLLFTADQQFIAPCAGVEFSCKLTPSLFFTSSPIIRFSRSVFHLEGVSNANSVSDYKWGSIVLPLCFKLKGESIKTTKPILVVGAYGFVNPSKGPAMDVIEKKWLSYGIQLGVGWEFPTKYVTFVPEVTFRFALADIFSVKRRSLSELPLSELKKTSSIRMSMVSFTLNLE